MMSIKHNIEGLFQKATFGMGCFWANDALFGATQGVIKTRVGYEGGTTLNPTYKNIADHTEVVEIDYDPKLVNFEKLLKLFWENHEYGYTTKIKKQYASIIFYHNDEQKELSIKSLEEVKEKINGVIQTQILPASIFYAAEDYHQKYRLQRIKWICEALQLTPTLLQSSHVAARLNGYVSGVGNEEDLNPDLKQLNVPEKVADFVKKCYNENKGGNLYC